MVELEDERSEDRVIYGFGNQCPLELVEGATVCKTFKEKRYGCRSCVSEAVSRNYLAKRAFDSLSHISRGKKDEAFDAAEMAESVQEMETFDQRTEYRNMVRKKSSWEWQAPERERSPRGKGKGEKGKGKGETGKGGKVKGDEGQGRPRGYSLNSGMKTKARGRHPLRA